jgi:hypothetical protein
MLLFLFYKLDGLCTRVAHNKPRPVSQQAIGCVNIRSGDVFFIISNQAAVRCLQAPALANLLRASWHLKHCCPYLRQDCLAMQFARQRKW